MGASKWGLLATLFLFCGSTFAAEVDSQIEFQLRAQPRVPVIVSLDFHQEIERRFDFPLDREDRQAFLEEKRVSFLQSLQSFRSSVNNMAPSQFGEVWLIDAITTEIDATSLDELRAHPLVKSIHLDREHFLVKPRQGLPDLEDGFTYGLKKFGIPILRAVYMDLTGQGIVAGVLDTGIDATHPDLEGKTLFFKDFTVNPEGEWSEPVDGHGHGTHVAGTIAGGDASGKAIGVAPETQLVIGRIFDSRGRTTTSAILHAMQWMADPDENFETAYDVPKVVNNSWGGSGDREKESPLYQAVEMWRKLQIFPCFAAGNSGPRPRTVGTPASYDIAFAVGATDKNDKIGSFSSRGPGWMQGEESSVELDKPDVSAPGVNIFSSLPGGKYDSWSGTSMATPHVTGAVVLLYQHYPFLTVEDMIDLLKDSALDLGAEGYDYNFGHGRVNPLKAAFDYIF